MALTPEEYQIELGKLQRTKERYDLIMAAQKYSEHEAHDISALLCFLRDCEDPTLSQQLELCLQAFINRKRLGIPIVFKKLRREFNIPS